MDENALLRRQLSELLDKQAVYEVLLGIARGVDRYDGRLLAEHIHPDAVIDMGGETTLTGADFAAALKPPATPPVGRMHLIGNHRIEISGDRAQAETYVISAQEIGEGEAGQTRMKAGRYLDRFERRDGAWKLTHRTFLEEWGRSDPVKEAPSKGRHRGRPAPDDLSYGREAVRG